MKVIVVKGAVPSERGRETEALLSLSSLCGPLPWPAFHLPQARPRAGGGTGLNQPSQPRPERVVTLPRTLYDVQTGLSR